MLAGRPDVRLTVDAKTNSLVVQAAPDEHAKIRELLGKLDVKPREFVVKPVAAADGVNTAAPGVEFVKRPAPGLPASTQVTYEVKSPAELIKILQPLLAGQPRVEMKSLANNSQLIVSPAEQQEAIRALVLHVDRAGTALADGVAKKSEPQKRIVAKFTNVDPAAAKKMLPQMTRRFELSGDLRLPGQIAGCNSAPGRTTQRTQRPPQQPDKRRKRNSRDAPVNSLRIRPVEHFACRSLAPRRR